ncbi:hypothetical protein HY640_01555, partial [Candidatus Woesearchaeota archaeon]|nr:hypothetical protein [Candidatus Woesearchaeota archaeon]
PPSPGSYSVSVNGSDGDNITVVSWNSTHYGINSTILEKATTRIDVILNFSRSETNISLNITDNASFNISQTFNFTVNVSMVGDGGSGCFVYISLNRTSVGLSPGESYSHSLGSIGSGQHVLTSWNLTANYTGSVNITVNSSCASDVVNFDNANVRVAYNITVVDFLLPVVSLEFPLNSTRAKNNQVLFRYNVSDDSAIANCSLFVDDVLNQTNYSVVRGVSMNFSAVIPLGLHNWSVNCTENSSNSMTGSSGNFLLNISPNLAPFFVSVSHDSPVDLFASSFREVECNASVQDSNEDDNISVNATWYFNSSQVFFGSADDNSTHYTNASCVNVSVSGEFRNFSCRTRLAYFASNGSWMCNFSAIDSGNLSSSSAGPFFINELVAVDAFPLAMEFGNITVTQVSQPQSVNVTNAGNIAINLTVFGFGGDNQSRYENYSFWCPRGLIDIGLERFGVDVLPYDAMHNLTPSPSGVNITLLKVVNQSNPVNVTNTTYWRVKVPPGVGGRCNGTVVFTGFVA